MRKKILLMLSAFCFMGATVFGQAIEGGAGIIHVDGDPNENPLLNSVSSNEGNVAYDKVNQIVYYYNPVGTDAADEIPGPPVIPAVVGTHWTAVSISGLVDPITSILTPEDELTATVTGTGEVTITFESDAEISFAGTTLTYTDVDGEVGGTVDFSTIADLVDVQAADASVTVTGNGTAATPYLISLTGATGAPSGTVPVTDGSGTLTWTNVVEDVTVNANGQIEVTYTNNATPVTLDMGSIPEVANIAELNAAAGALSAGTTGLARAANNNTFGMPATSNVGVLFFISN